MTGSGRPPLGERESDARDRPVDVWGRRAIAVVAIVPIGAFVWTALRRIAYPYELSYVEGSVYEVVARVTTGDRLYVAPTTDFAPWPYPPLYFWVSAALARLTGLELPALRVVSFGAALVVLLVLALIVRSVTGSGLAGLLTSGIFAATYWLSDTWADTGRVDSLFLALVLLSVLAGVHARTWRGGLLVGLLVLAAFLTKQNAVLAAAPMLLWLVVYRRTVGVWATATAAGGVVVSTLIGNATTDGWYSVYVFQQLAGQGWSVKWIYQFWLADLVMPFAVVAIVATLAIVAGRGQVRERPRLAELMATPAGLVWSAIVGLLLAAWAGRLHVGGSVNVVLPAYAAVALAMGLGVARVLERPRAIRGLTVATLALVLAAQTALLLAWFRTDAVPSAADRRAGDQLVALIESVPGDVLLPSQPYLARLGGKSSAASLFAVEDVLRGANTRARTTLERDLPWSLDGVDAVVLNDAGHADFLGPDFAQNFVRVVTPVLTTDALYPVTDYPSRPQFLYVRRGVELS